MAFLSKIGGFFRSVGRGILGFGRQVGWLFGELWADLGAAGLFLWFSAVAEKISSNPSPYSQADGWCPRGLPS